jgi:hypothetical protein
MPRFQLFEQHADDLDMETCSCGARLPENAAWCPVCLKVPVDRSALLDELHETFRKTSWIAPETLTAPSPPPVYSRWRAGPRSFGLRVKLAITFVTLGITVLGVISFGYFFSAPVIISATLLMYSVWVRERVR